MIQETTHLEIISLVIDRGAWHDCPYFESEVYQTGSYDLLSIYTKLFHIDNLITYQTATYFR